MIDDPNFQPSEANDDIFEVLGIGDDTGGEPATPPAGNDPQAPEPSPPAAAEAGEGVDAPSPSPVTPPEPAAPQPANAQAPEATPPPAAPAPESAAPTPPVADDKLRTASLEAQVQGLQAELERLRANPTGAQPQQPAESGEQQAAPVTRYNLTLPQQVKEALFSDDPETSGQAINTIFNDLGTIVHNAVVTQMRGEVSEMFRALVGAANMGTQQTEKATAVDAARQAYYDAFPGHNKAEVLPIIQAKAREMSTQYPGLPWNADYIAALGQRVNAHIAALGGQAADPQQQQQPPAKPAAALPSGNRQPVVLAGSETGSDLIEDTLQVF